MKKLRLKSIHQASFVVPISVLTLLTVSIVAYFLFNKRAEFERSVEQFEQLYLQSQKNIVETIVNRSIDQIAIQREQLSRRMDEMMKAKVYEACALASQLYDSRTVENEARVRALMHQLYSPVRNADGGSLFILSRNGRAVLDPMLPESSAHPLSVSDQARNRADGYIQTAVNSGEAFVDLYRGARRVRVFVKYFEPLQWVIGFGYTSDEIESYIQQTIISQFEKLRFSEYGYLWILDTDHRLIMHPFFKRSEYQEWYEPGGLKGYRDIRGTELFANMVEVCSAQGSGYVQYYWEKPNIDGKYQKTSFVQLYPDWNWIVGAGVYMDDMYAVIDAQRSLLNRQNWRAVFMNLVIFSLLLTGVVFIIKSLSSRIREGFNVFGRFFREAAVDLQPIEEKKLPFDEFRDLAAFANSMVETRNTTEAALRENEQKFRSVFATSPDAIVISRQSNGIIVDVNAGFCEMTGYSRDEVVGRTSADLELWENSADRQFLLNSVTGQGEMINFEAAIRLKDGRSGTGLISARTMMLDGVHHLLVCARDVTAHKAAQVALREERDFSDTLLQSSPVFYTAVNSDLKMKMVNRCMLDSLQYSFEELYLEDLVQKIIPASERQKVYRYFSMVLEGDGPGSLETRVVKCSGEELIVEWHSRRMTNGAGPQEYLLIVGIEVTERRKAERKAAAQQQQLIEADKLASLGVLVAGVAHEVNNPSQSIMLNAQLLQDAWQGANTILDRYYGENGEFLLGGAPYSRLREQIPEYISGVIDDVFRIKSIVSDLRDFARRDDDENRTAFDVNEAVRSALKLIANFIKKSTVEFSVVYTPDMAPVLGVKQRLEQVVINLVQNACQALSGPDKAITVKTWFDESERCVVVEVADEGSGMTGEQLKKIKDPFFTTKRDIGGTGLGLSVSDSIIREHGGRLEFSSRPGAGTTAYVYLPAVSQ
jgi:PAS domain S-box-containing protein